MSNDIDDMDALFEAVAAETASASASGADKPAVAAVVAPAAQSAAAAPVVLPVATTEESTDGKMIYDRLGGIVRTLHDSMRELGYDKALSASAENINDAQDRLAYIATLTEAAANKVLNLLDIAMPAQAQLADNAKVMNARWKSMLNGDLSVEDFKKLANDSLTFTEQVVSESEVEKARLLDIMMSQDFQDLTGQIIKKVIIVTQNVENSLAQLLLDSAPIELKEKVATNSTNRHERPVDLLSGPDVPTNAMAQDDVDSMLADLGF